MTERGFLPNLVSFNALLQALCRVRMPEETEELLENMMNQKGLSPDHTSYMSLIHMFSVWDVDIAYQLFTQMLVTGFSPSVAIFNDLIRGYCYVDRADQALEILRAMPFSFSPDVDIYSLIIHNLPDLDKALQIKAEMLQKAILPDAKIYSFLIVSLCYDPRLLEAFDLFHEMLRAGFSLSTNKHAYTSLINACCLEAQFTKLFHLHHAITHNHYTQGGDFVPVFSPPLVTYNALIHGYCFLGRVQEALEILRGMPEIGLSPNAVSFSTIIAGFCQIQELHKAYELMLEMDEKDIGGDMDQVVYLSLFKGLSDEATFASLINAYCAEGEVYKAMTLNDEMKRYGSLRNDVLYIVFINGLDKKARTREAKEILLSMFCNLGTRRPTFTYDTLIENCSNNEFKSMVELAKGYWMRGLKNEAASVMNTVLQWKHKPDGAVYNLLIVEHCWRGNVDKAYNMYMEMVQHGFASHMFSVLALINLCYHRRVNEKRKVIQNVLSSCNLNDSELHTILNEIDASQGCKGALLNVLAELAMDGLLLNGGKCSYAPASA